MAYLCFVVSPIVAHVKLALDDSTPQSGPKKHRNFFTKFRTFNAPMNLSISHAKNLKPGRLSLMAENVLGPMDVSLDSQYTGTFDVRAKASTVQVLQSSASDNHLFLLRKVGHGQRWRRRRWETRAAFCGCLTGAGPWLDGTTGDWKSLIVIHWAASSS
jgi:hypothetical protein